MPPAHSDDRIRLPPPREVFVSPGGQYRLVITMQGAPAEWAKAGSKASLFSSAAGPKPLWEKHLPHSYRPRFALVADDGTSVLFDQWINVFGPLAVTVIGRSGELIASHASDDVAAALEVSRAELARGGRHGPWMSAPPTLDASVACVDAGGRTLIVRLSDGALSGRWVAGSASR